MTINPLFIHLRTKTAYSFTQSSVTTKGLVAALRSTHSPAVAVTDDANLFGALEFSSAAKKAGVQPIIGATVDVDVGQVLGTETPRDRVLLLCKSASGYKALSRLITRAHLAAADVTAPSVSVTELVADCDDLICLWGGARSTLVTHLLRFPDADGEALEPLLKTYFNAFGDRLYLEIQRCGEPWEQQVESRILSLAYKHAVPIVGTNDVHFLKPEDHERYDILSCIGRGEKEYDPNRTRLNGEHYLKSPEQMIAVFADLPECVDNSIEIARRCSFFVAEHPPILPIYGVPDGRTAEEQLRIEVYQGFEDRFLSVVKRLGESEATSSRNKYIERLEFELGVITRMNFAGYFLIVSDFMKWTKAQQIPVGVRGSGATSMVAWCMYITNLDPLRFNLVFERFLNPERVSLPDFDIDFCQERRGEVISYVRQKYGSDKVAQIISFGTLQAKAAVRDVGRVIGAPFPLVDKLAKLIGAAETLGDALQQEPGITQLLASDALASRCFSLAQQLEGLYRNASMHAAGVIISAVPLVDILPLYKDPKSDLPLTQFNYKDAEKVGLVKFDFLGLRTLTIISEAVSNILEYKGIRIDVNNLDFEDERVYDMLSSGEVSGVFQLESSGMRDLLRKLRPRKIEQLIALISLYRPGPMDSIPEFIARANGGEAVTFDHPLLEPVLAETYGIITYQEDVMRIARDLGGYSLGEADFLRRAMGKKIKSEMDEHRARFRSGAAERGVDPGLADLIFEKCAKFAGYGFNKGHAAAYAQVSYQTAYLRCNFPTEFYAACMSVDQDRVDRLETYVRELRERGTAVLRPDINASRRKFALETDGNGNECIRYGLGALRGIGNGPSEAIQGDRLKKGAFCNVDDFFVRMAGKVSKAVSQQLAKAGAFDTFEAVRGRLLSELDDLVRDGQLRASERQKQQGALFADEILRTRRTEAPKVSRVEELEWERDAIGFYLSGHPLDGASSLLDRRRYVSIAQLSSAVEENGSYTSRVVCLIEKLDLRRSAKSGRRYAFVGVSDPSGALEALAFSDTLEAAGGTLAVDTPVVCEVTGELSDGEIRYTVGGVQPLSAAYNSLKAVTLPLSGADHTEQLAYLKQELTDRAGGTVEVLLEVPLQALNSKAIVSLPSQYRVDFEFLSEMDRRFVGVRTEARA